MVDDTDTAALTAEAIRQRLGFSTIAMPSNERLGAREIGMIREAGITRIEICGLRPPTHYDYHDPVQVSEIVSECRNQGVAIVSMHGPGLQYDCPYEKVRQAVVKEAVESARIAAEIGASVFVAHFNANEHAERTICEMIERLDDTDIMLAIENLPGAPISFLAVLRYTDKIRVIMDGTDILSFGVCRSSTSSEAGEEMRCWRPRIDLVSPVNQIDRLRACAKTFPPPLSPARQSGREKEDWVGVFWNFRGQAPENTVFILALLIIGTLHVIIGASEIRPL